MSNTPPDASNILTVSIISPEAVLYEGTARALSCYNKEGEFDILPLHSNFISLIYKRIVVHPVTGESTTIEIGYALLKSLGNVITILTNVDISSYSEILTSTASSSQETQDQTEQK